METIYFSKHSSWHPGHYAWFQPPLGSVHVRLARACRHRGQDAFGTSTARSSPRLRQCQADTAAQMSAKASFWRKTKHFRCSQGEPGRYSENLNRLLSEAAMAVRHQRSPAGELSSVVNSRNCPKMIPTLSCPSGKDIVFPQYTPPARSPQTVA